MKALKLICSTIAIILMSVNVTSCSYDDSELWDSFEKLEERVAILENLCKQNNENITSLQTIVDVFESGDYITDVVPMTMDGKEIGYKITFAKAGTITIHHGTDGKDGQNGQNGANGKDGKDGHAPVVGVKQDTDGVYYWTLDGEFIVVDGKKMYVQGKDGKDGADGKDGVNGTDGKDGADGKDGVNGTDGKDGADGKDGVNGTNGKDGADGKDGVNGMNGKDGADGQNGKDGLTPQFKIEDGYWYISYNGVDWTSVGKATGDNGSDSNCIFSEITQDDENVYFTLADGTIIQVTKIAVVAPGEVPFNQIWYKTKDGEAFDFELNLARFDAEIQSNEYVDGKGVLTFKKTVTGIEYFGNDSYNITEIYLPNSIVYIADIAFVNCDYLEYIKLSEGIKIIGNNSFNLCPLSNLVLPEGLETIGNMAFGGCENIETIVIPKTVKIIGYGAFANCKNLNTIEVADGNSYFSSVDGVLYDKSETQLLQCPGRKNDVMISDNVITIGEYSFSGCYNLTNITIPNSVSIIGGDAFADCSELLDITIPNSITTIGGGAFSGCSKLTSVDIPSNVMSIGEKVFSGCVMLTSINVDESNPNYASFDGVLYNKDMSVLLECPEGKTNVELNNEVKTIADYAFYNCDNLTNLVFPNTLVSMGSNAFYDCDNFTNIELPNSLTSIGDYAFFSCSSLRNIKLSDNLYEIGMAAFMNCTTLEEIIIPEGITILKRQTFAANHKLSKVVLPNSLTELGHNVFSSCTSLERIDLPSNINYIEGILFNKCRKLKEVYCSALVPPAFYSEMFYNMDIPTIYVPTESLSAYKNHEYWQEFADNLVGFEF